MSIRQFTGCGSTLEEAITAAADEAMNAWKPSHPDDMTRVKLDSVNLLYGGIVGFTGLRMATVSLVESKKVATVAGAGSAPPKPELALKLDLLPDTIYANMMPPVRRPQPHKVGMLLTVTNIGETEYQGQSPDTAVARFTMLRGRTVIWRWPQVAGQVITPVTIKPLESRTYSAIWEIADVVDLVDADLHAVALFVPSRDSAMQRLQVKPIF